MMQNIGDVPDLIGMARRILEDGAIPTYIHDPRNTGSCRVAEAAGFPDRGWHAQALWRRRTGA